MAGQDSERGRPATFDPKSGEVQGSGSGAGGGGNGQEDYDQDPMAGSGAEPPHGPRPAGDPAKRPIDPDEGI
jgi:hypothetical protein